MENKRKRLIPLEVFDAVRSFLRRCLFHVLSFGPMPRHIAFILDGNRRYGRKWNLKPGEAHCQGFLKLMSILRYCHEMGVKYVTVYAFSIDNFNRKPTEVQHVMGLIQEKIEVMIEDGSTLNDLGVKVEFLGNLKLVNESIREGAKKVMEATAMNTRIVLIVCIAYTSTDEIVHGVQGSCDAEWARNQGGDGGREDSVSMVNLERHMYFAGHPDPDILIRTSGETRLSNFVLWQTTFCLLYAPRCLWPELSLRHLVWAVIEYQRFQPYLEKIKKQV